MEKTPAQTLELSIANFRKFLAEYDALFSKKTDSENRLADLSANGDLADKQVLAEIAQIQVFVQLFPSRIQARANQFRPAMVSFNNDCQSFINALYERSEAILTGVRAKATATLAEHFHDESALAAAVEKSGLVSEANQIVSAAKHTQKSSMFANGLDSEGLVRRGESLLTMWADVDAFESKLQTQS